MIYKAIWQERNKKATGLPVYIMVWPEFFQRSAERAWILGGFSKDKFTPEVHATALRAGL